MPKFAPAALIVLAAGMAAAEETRQLDAHEHGVGTLDIAFDGDRIALEFTAPGADIVGFEYTATSAQDRAAVDAAVATLARPLDLFSLPAEAGCSVIEASAALESEEAHDDHAHDGAGHKDHDHEDHAGHKHDGHDHAAQAETAHDHDHDHDHDHAEHAAHASHTEFHAEYLLTCADPARATLITFGYFDTFPNARELEVQVITERGATAFEVLREAPALDLRDMF